MRGFLPLALCMFAATLTAAQAGEVAGRLGELHRLAQPSASGPILARSLDSLPPCTSPFALPCRMRIALTLLLAVLASPLGAQAIALPSGCADPCSPGALALDSISIRGGIRDGRATMRVDHIVRNRSTVATAGGVFFPLPDGAEIDRVFVERGVNSVSYNQWTPPDEARALLDRERERQGVLDAAHLDAPQPVVYVALPEMAPGDVLRVQISYLHPIEERQGSFIYRYPLAPVSRDPATIVRLLVEVSTPAGFEELQSPTHEIQTWAGMEPAPCSAEVSCGMGGFPSRRIRVVYLTGAPDGRDFELHFTPRPLR